MNFTKHISAANKLFDRKNPIAALQSALINEGICTVGNIYAQYSFPVPVKGVGCIDWLDFREILKAGLTEGRVEILPGDIEGDATLWCDTSEIHMVASDPTAYPVIQDNFDLVKYSVPAAAVTTALRFVDSEVSKDTGLRPLNCVRIERGKVIGTNGHVVFVDYLANPANTYLEISLDPKVVATLPTIGTLQIIISPKDGNGFSKHFQITSDTNDAVIVARNVEGQYPDVGPVMYTPEYQGVLTKKHIENALNKLRGIFQDEGFITISLVDSTETIDVILSAEDKEGRKYAKINCGAVRGNNYCEIEVFPEYLEAAMTLNPHEVHLAWGDKSKPFYVNGALVTRANIAQESID